MKTFLWSFISVFMLCYISNKFIEYHDNSPKYSTNNAIENKPARTNTQTNHLRYQTVVSFIKQCEGFRSKPYYCKAGARTIGYGSRTFKHSHVCQINRTTASQLLKTRIQHDYDSLIKYTSRDTALVMCSFAYNCGLKPALRLVKAHRVHTITNYINARHKPLQGLINRRKQELAMLRKD